LARSNTSPVTGLRMPTTRYFPNHALRAVMSSAIEEVQSKDKAAQGGRQQMLDRYFSEPAPKTEAPETVVCTRRKRRRKAEVPPREP
ncbi:unnamed protein product, partial [Polarella glacialis]